MEGPILKRKVTVAKLAPTTPATSRPSSRNSSRPSSPTKSFLSASSPLASSTTPTPSTRPKAKINSSAIRRTPSSTTTTSESPILRPSSPARLSKRDGALSPPTSTLGIGSRKTVVRLKASSSISSTASTSPTTTLSASKPKSPSPELRARSLTASSDTLRSNSNNPESRKRQASAAAVLHHASSFSNLQPPSAEPGSPVPPPDSINGNNGVLAPRPIKIRSKVSTMAKNLNDVTGSTPSASTTPTPEPLHVPPSIPSPTTSRPGTVRVRAGSISSNVSFTNARTSSPGPGPGPSPTSPPTPNTPHHRHSRTHSQSSSPTHSALPAYPITTAVPAANPHRYGTTSVRANHSSGLRSSFSSSPSSPSPKFTDEFRPFAKTTIFPPTPTSISSGGGTGALNGFQYGSYGRAGATGIATGLVGSSAYTNTNNAHVDPVNIPLPPQSPPTSSLSISSRSSVSLNHNGHVNDSGATTSPESSVVSSSSRGGGTKKRRDQSSKDDITHHHGGTESTIVDEEKKARAEAKSNRKIADLEITNRSLLAINATLEKTKDRQAKEIRELKRKLRETRLILPPRAYRAVKSSLDPDEIGDDEEDIDSASSDDDDDDDDDDDEEFHSADEGKGKQQRNKSDETYKRIKLLLENLLDTGRQALEKTKEDFIDAKGGAKVLTVEEVESWRDSGVTGNTADDTIMGGRLSDLDTLDDDEDDGYEDDEYSQGRLSRSHSPTPQPTVNKSVARFGPGISGGFGSSSMSSPKPPPILITESS